MPTSKTPIDPTNPPLAVQPSAATNLNDTLRRIPLDLLDANPWQPRTVMDERKLVELVDSIRMEGLLQPIVVMPMPDGRFLIVAGHRRVEAYKRLRDAATTETERQKWNAINAVLKVGLVDAELASKAYKENMDREELSLLDEARALENMIEKGLAKTNEELATLLQQNPTRIKRLRRVGCASRIIRDGVSAGLMVAVSTDADGKETRELKRLELRAALAFIRFHEHLKRTQPSKAEERLESSVRRALAGNWTVKRCEEHVDRVINGGRDEPVTGKVDVAAAPAGPVFNQTAHRFVVDLARLKEATEEQLAALKRAMEQLVARAGVGAPEPGSP